MLEMIAGRTPVDEELVNEVREYIDRSTGIQTIFQMKWLSEAVKRHGRNNPGFDDPWLYKTEYNNRLMEIVDARKMEIENGHKIPGDFMIRGSRGFLGALAEKGIELYAASGTDHPDVVNEAGILGIKDCFREIAGAPPGKADCSKEAVLRRLIGENVLKGTEVLVVGDGRVEIALGREVGAVTLGVASDEVRRHGINPVKRARLQKAGAHAIIGDFEETDKIINWLFDCI